MRKGGNPGCTQEQLIEAINLVEQYGTPHKAANAVGMPRGTLRNRYRRAQEAIAKGEFGDGIVPGFRIKSLTTDEDGEGNISRRHIRQVPDNGTAGPLPEGHTVKGISRYTDGQGNLIGQWTKTKADEPDPVKIAQEIAKAFDGIKVKLPRIDVPLTRTEDLLTLYPLADLHLGLMTWGKETQEDWDLKIAARSIRATMAEVVARSPVSDTAILLSVGDIVHSDNNRNITAKSGNSLDVDGRYQKILHETCQLMLDVALMVLQKHEKLVIRVLPGNHDEHTAVAVAYFLMAAFKDEERVTVDVDPSLFFVYPFGDVLLAATHGHSLKPQKLYQWLTSAHRDKWGAAKHVHGYVGHFHHREKLADEMGGMLIETLPAPIPPDAWHFGAGYISGRSMGSYTYHAKDGLISQLNQTMRKK